MFKVKNKLCPEITSEKYYSIRDINYLGAYFIGTVYNGTESISYL